MASQPSFLRKPIGAFICCGGLPLCCTVLGPGSDLWFATKVVKLFPASYQDGWFFEPKSEGEQEQELVSNSPTAMTDPDPLNHYHLSEICKKANPDFKGAISVPLLWDTAQNTTVSNSSLGLAELMETQLKSMATKNQDLELYPKDANLQKEHKELCQWIHSNIATTAVYKMNATRDGKKHDEMVENYYQALRDMQG